MSQKTNKDCQGCKYYNKECNVCNRITDKSKGVKLDLILDFGYHNEKYLYKFIALNSFLRLVAEKGFYCSYWKENKIVKRNTNVRQ